MKKIILLFLGVAVFSSTWSQVQRVDTVALMILNRMADVIGELNSCTYTLKTTNDVIDLDLGIIQQSGTDEVTMVGPDKMLVHSYGNKGHRGYWYNGETVTYYSFKENNYASVEGQSDIISTISAVNKNYGIYFPAADFFYPTFTDDINNNYSTILFGGIKDIEGEECFHIIVANEEQNIQLWIANDAFSLPKKIMITDKNQANMQYSAIFLNWIINPEIPHAVFEFSPPPQANEISILPITIE